MDMKEQRYGIEIEMTGLASVPHRFCRSISGGLQTLTAATTENIPCWTARAAAGRS